MRTQLLSLTAAAVLAAALVPATYASDPSPSAGDRSGSPRPAEMSPATASALPAETPAPTAAGTAAPTGPYDGTVVEDPTFVSGGEIPTQPASARPPPGGPRLTPPPTDRPATGR